jgi:serine/threonine protein kinase
MEFQCREMRSRVAGAHWIDSALTLFADLRNGRRPGEVLAANPRLADIFYWLQRYERKSIPEARPLETLPADDQADRRPGHLSREGRLGQGQAVALVEALDAWVPEAKGSSARVFQGFCKDAEGHIRQAAIKIMRPDKVDYALPLFWEEAQILAILEDLPGVARLIECGYLQFDGSQDLPPEDSPQAAHALTGSALLYGLDEVDLFVQGMEEKVSLGWLPFLALEKKNKEDCLLLHCDEGYTRGNVLPVDQGLEIAVKICDILEIAHARDIVYRDHKILHYYWNFRLRKVSTIDWNVAKWYPQGASETEIQQDLVQFGARTLHHILTGRPAPGALPVGPNRPQDIEMSPQHYSPAWTYDDYQRLPGEVMDLLAKVLAGSYDSAARLREDLLIQIPYR